MLALIPVFAYCSPSVRRIDESRQATGVRVGEVTANGAVIWTRVTEKAARRADGIERRGRPDKSLAEQLEPRDLEGSVPGASGRVRVLYGTDESRVAAASQAAEGVLEEAWESVSPDRDYTHQFRLQGLSPSTVYYFKTETSSPDGAVLHAPLYGQFQTAPSPGEYADVTFTVITGQAYRDADAPDGFLAYDSMARLNPAFLIPTGDTVYYDSDDPLVTSIGLARYHWHRIYSYPKLVQFHRRFPAYWEKDDHDSYHNDNWPGMVQDYMGEFTFEQGLKVFAEQVPTAEKPYRTFRWGKGLQVWLTEGRDFRSPNTMEDGPEKTIWGEEQKAWLKRTLLESDADWKVLVSPTPIVGPDRANKGDNHSNLAFQHEGDEIRRWFQENLPDNFFVACGDRHWQYHSVHPTSGVHEFSCGPISDPHAGGSPGLDETYHRFHRQMGGFLSVNTRRAGNQSAITFRLHAVDGTVEYEYTRSASVE